MIFVSVGTHEQPMVRLFQKLEELIHGGEIHEPVVVQSGVTSFPFKVCEHEPFFPFREMERKMREARVIITHGGPATILQARNAGKLPIVVPRHHAFGEHVNDHQIVFARRLFARGQILLIENIEDLGLHVRDYENLAMKGQIQLGSPVDSRGELCRRLTEYCDQI